MKTTIIRFFSDESAVTTVEYSVLLCGLILGAAAIWIGFRGNIQMPVANAATTLDEAAHL